jgi:hypothetical protein
MAVLIALQIPYRLLALGRSAGALITPRWQAILGYGLIALLLLNWLADLIAGHMSLP